MTRYLLSLLLAFGLALGTSPVSAQFLFTPRAQAPALRAQPAATHSRRAPQVRWRAWRSGGVISPTRPHRPIPEATPAADGRVICDVTENGVGAPATVEVRRGGRVVASGRCGTNIEVPGGSYDATITLESAIDRPQRTVPLFVPSNGVGRAEASFETSIIEVRFSRDGRPAFGQAVLLLDGQRVGSIGHRNAARVSSGRLTVQARYRTTTQTYDLFLRPGQRRAIQARF